ncbi:Met-10+ like-protein-domain-containing protein [Radiomyces spectabilis]|uniref:Met-10+ like-protein-domain-containing protein n=1 Tax=Radiomyces spectabilis TaxID=64574 RepID=UPI0022202C41|nr:Met-10+ like-protein-domain-containing protein [Radiomyces spectabilis]KAI8370715.1 Met-10+ like-protein-domain-containing protein [Radiomyces spectabilis]
MLNNTFLRKQSNSFSEPSFMNLRLDMITGLQAVMPSENTEVPSSFTIVGHIVHLNLKEEHEPYKRLIAEVLLDKNKKVTSVVNKTNNIDNTYRNFQMEVLAGDGNMVASLKENGCRFTFDFSKVYWNSRLQAEHRRIVDMFQKGSTVLDVFAGVGPFALPAVKKGCLVYANDLNPASYHWLNENIRLNKITAGIHTYNMDGREFIRKVMDDVLRTSPGITVDHVVMNLPAIAIEFLDAFRGVYQSFDTTTPLPMIHCHCFTRNTNPEKDIKERLCHAMGSSSDFDVSLHWVRTVAPKKEMYCVSFRLPFEIAFAS